ncbi:hypothetical protein D9M71_349490 [compost metagenome]
MWRIRSRSRRTKGRLIDSRRASWMVGMRPLSSLRKLLKVWMPPPVKKLSYGLAEYLRCSAASSMGCRLRSFAVMRYSTAHLPMKSSGTTLTVFSSAGDRYEYSRCSAATVSR